MWSKQPSKWPGHQLKCEAIDQFGLVVRRWRSFMAAFEDFREKGWDRATFSEAVELGIVRRCPEGLYEPPAEPDLETNRMEWVNEQNKLSQVAKVDKPIWRRKRSELRALKTQADWARRKSDPEALKEFMKKVAAGKARAKLARQVKGPPSP